MSALPADLSVQPLGPFDVAVAAALHAACFDEAWSESAVAELLAMPGSFGLLAAAGGEPVGMILLVATTAEAEILTLCVLPSWRRRGIGRCLLRAAARRLVSDGVLRLFLEVAEDNLSARALYGAHGLVEVGRRPGYYRRARGKTATALVLAGDVAGLGTKGGGIADLGAETSRHSDVASR